MITRNVSFSFSHLLPIRHLQFFLILSLYKVTKIVKRKKIYEQHTQVNPIRAFNTDVWRAQIAQRVVSGIGQVGKLFCALNSTLKIFGFQRFSASDIRIWDCQPVLIYIGIFFWISSWTKSERIFFKLFLKLKFCLGPNTYQFLCKRPLSKVGLYMK